MIDSFRRAIYHTLKAGWYWVFGEPRPHVHKFEPYWTAPHTLIQRCACGEDGPSQPIAVPLEAFVGGAAIRDYRKHHNL